MKGTKYATAKKEHINKYKMAHSIGVAEYMRENAWRYNLDGEEMYVLGLLHDIGYIYGREGHEKSGFKLLMNMGLKAPYLTAINLHGRNPYEIEKEVGFSLREECPALVLLYEADMSVNAQGFKVGFDGRI